MFQSKQRRVDGRKQGWLQRREKNKVAIEKMRKGRRAEMWAVGALQINCGADDKYDTVEGKTEERIEGQTEERIEG